MRYLPRPEHSPPNLLLINYPNVHALHYIDSLHSPNQNLAFLRLQNIPNNHDTTRVGAWTPLHRAPIKKLPIMYGDFCLNVVVNLQVPMWVHGDAVCL